MSYLEELLPEFRKGAKEENQIENVVMKQVKGFPNYLVDCRPVRKDEVSFYPHKKMNNLIKDIIKWHKDTFPDATLSGQVNKLNEELDEFLEADRKVTRLEEAADIFIVECALLRWNVYISYTKLIMIANFGFSYDDLMDAVKKKMEKNKKRVWKKTENGSYHHV